MISFTLPLSGDGAIVAVQYGFARPTERIIRLAGRAVLQPSAALGLIDPGQKSA